MIPTILTLLVLAVVAAVYASLFRGTRPQQPTTLRRLANSNPRFLL